MNEIKERYKVIKSFIEKWHNELLILQEKCPHTNHNSEYKSNTGNYDNSSDSYWIKYTCNDCGKKWDEDQ